MHGDVLLPRAQFKLKTNIVNLWIIAHVRLSINQRKEVIFCSFTKKGRAIYVVCTRCVFLLPIWENFNTKPYYRFFLLILYPLTQPNIEVKKLSPQWDFLFNLSSWFFFLSYFWHNYSILSGSNIDWRKNNVANNIIT